MTNRPDVPDLNERLIIDTSEGKTSYLLIGKNGSYMKLSSSAYHLLQSINSGVSFEALAQRLAHQQGRPVAVAEVERAYQHVVTHIEKIEGRVNRTPFGFWFRMTWFPAWLVARIARVLAVAFHPLVAAVLIGLSLTILLVRIRDIPAPTAFLGNDVSFWSVYSLFLLSVIIHEFGHASACARYGGKPSDIGFSFYWLFPVLYSDVNDVWRLRRWQRVVVDLGGAYFQLVVGAVYLAISVVTGWPDGQYTLALILYSFLVTLNPILKFDGYWLMADILGVVNLWQQPGRMLRYFYNRLRGREVQPLPWSAWVTGFVAVYTPIAVGFWAYFMYRIMRVVWNVSNNYPAVVQYVFYDLFHPPYRFPFERIQYVVIPTLTVLSVILTLFNLARLCVRLTKAPLRRLLTRRKRQLLPNSQQ